MKETNLNNTKINLSEEMSAGNYDKVIANATLFQKEIVDSWLDQDMEKLTQLFLASRFSLKLWEKNLEKEKRLYAALRCGAWIGTIETIQNSLFESSQNEKLEQNELQEIISTRHFPDIIGILELKSVMTHGDLAKELDLMPSTLTEVMKKARKYGIVSSRKYGKYVLYSLTDTGIRCGKLLRKTPLPDTLQTVISQYDMDLTRQELHFFLEQLKEKGDGYFLRRGEQYRVKFGDSEFQYGIFSGGYELHGNKPDAGSMKYENKSVLNFQEISKSNKKFADYSYQERA